MKKVILLVLFGGLWLPLRAQISAPQQASVYLVGIDSKDNRIILSVANASLTTAIDSLRVRLERHPAAVSVSQPLKIVHNILPGKESDCEFMFSIDRTAKPNAQDTLDFTVSDGRTIMGWETIVIKYKGPGEYLLEQNFPNPFNPATKIYYQLPFPSRVTLKLYDILGREVKSLFDGSQDAGYQESTFDGTNSSTGVYFLRMVAESTAGPKTRYVNVKKMLFVK
jgi:hypothetical protein